ncbi:hypothetical protein B0J18DRAFT_139959 [Chaetomium sp. MPI-SDFR-AT-0129]|nr:hypothetical protein B0J18DRAFT_139959 [Chaetomium sp. MPI-SDFR-AT-0129]
MFLMLMSGRVRVGGGRGHGGWLLFVWLLLFCSFSLPCLGRQSVTPMALFLGARGTGSGGWENFLYGTRYADTSNRWTCCAFALYCVCWVELSSSM